MESSFLKACWEMRAREGEAKNSLLYSLERSSKISSVLYKDSQYVLENLQVVGKFLSPSLSMVLFAESNPSEDYYYLYCHLNFCLYTCSVSADKHLLICFAETVCSFRENVNTLISEKDKELEALRNEVRASSTDSNSTKPTYTGASQKI